MPKRTAKRRSHLLGSCQCGKVHFSIDSETPVPFMYCFCSICRKTGGAAFGCNIMGIRDTLEIRGKRSLRAYNARIREPGKKTVVSGPRHGLPALPQAVDRGLARARGMARHREALTSNHVRPSCRSVS